MQSKSLENEWSLKLNARETVHNHCALADEVASHRHTNEQL